MRVSLLIIAITIASTFSTFAQTTKTVKYNSEAAVTYTVGSDGQTKDGLYYVKNTSNDATLMQGHYKDGKRAGIWYFFDAKKNLAKRYNYDQNKLVYLNNDELKGINVDVKGLDTVQAKEASVPVPLCSVDVMRDILFRKVYAYNTDDANGKMESQLIAHVASDGTATYNVRYKTGKNFQIKKMDVDNKDFKIDWVPSVYKGKPVEADFIVYSDVALNSAEHRRVRWNN
jgi:hypothetical protein